MIAQEIVYKLLLMIFAAIGFYYCLKLAKIEKKYLIKVLSSKREVKNDTILMIIAAYFAFLHGIDGILFQNPKNIIYIFSSIMCAITYIALEIFLITRAAGAVLSFLCMLFSVLLYRNICKYGIPAYSKIFLKGRKFFIILGIGGIVYILITLLGIILNSNDIKYLGYPILMLFFVYGIFGFYKITKF